MGVYTCRMIRCCLHHYFRNCTLCLSLALFMLTLNGIFLSAAPHLFFVFSHSISLALLPHKSTVADCLNFGLVVCRLQCRMQRSSLRQSNTIICQIEDTYGPHIANRAENLESLFSICTLCHMGRL